jgi:hypothetical protein
MKSLVQNLIPGILLSLLSAAPAFAQAATMPDGPTVSEAVMFHPSQPPVWFTPLFPPPPEPFVTVRPRAHDFVGRADTRGRW